VVLGGGYQPIRKDGRPGVRRGFAGAWDESADRATVTLQSYVDSVAEFIERHDLKNVVLAGHSLGGLTIPGVAAKIPSRIKRVVWVTALVALDGQPIVDPATSPLAAAADTVPERSIPIEMMGKEFLDGLSNDMAPAVKEYVLSALGPQPIRADDYAGRDGALLCYRNPEQLHRLR